MNYFDILLAKKLEDDRDPKVEGLSVSANGRYHEDGVVYDPVIVNVPEPTLKTKSITANGTYQASSDNADGYSQVSVHVSGYKISEVSGLPASIATFTDGSALPMPKLEVAIEPVQEGSGDPSPTNVRPISGWDEVNVSVSGKNLFDKNNATVIDGYITGSGAFAPSNRGEKSVLLGYLKSGTYTISKQLTSIFRIGLFTTIPSDTSINSIQYADSTSDKTKYTMTLNNNGYLVAFIWNNTGESGTLTDVINTIQVEVGNTATTYEPYNGQTYTIPFTDSQGNPIEVYGGSVDVVNGGEQLNTKGKDDLGDLNWGMLSANIFYTGDIATKKYGGALMCSQYPVVTNVTADSEVQYKPDKSICGNTTNTLIYIKDSSYSDTATFKNAMRGVELVYEIVTPTTFYTQPTAIKSLNGTNNLWADTGDVVEASYWEEL